jgi:ribosomal-protein-alanine N-acetyltransferase
VNKEAEDRMFEEIFYKFPIIEIDENYILREMNDADAENFHHYYTDSEVNKHIYSYIPTSLEESRNEIMYWANFYKRREGIYWGIVQKEDNKLIGSIGYTNWVKHYNRAELSYDLAKEYWNKGIITAAIQKVLEFGFSKMNLNRVQAYTSTENAPSEKVLVKNGFVKEGLLREDRLYKGQYRDIKLYSVLRRDFLQQGQKSIKKPPVEAVCVVN